MLPAVGRIQRANPTTNKVLACRVVLKIIVIMYQAQVLEADFQLLPHEASPAWGPLMSLKWNPVLLSLSPQQWLLEVLAVEPGGCLVWGDVVCFAAHLMTESGGISATALCLFLLVLVLIIVLVVTLFWCSFPTFASYAVFFKNLSAGTSTAPGVLLLPFRDNICRPCFREALDFSLL